MNNWNNKHVGQILVSVQEMEAVVRRLGDHYDAAKAVVGADWHIADSLWEIAHVAGKATRRWFDMDYSEIAALSWLISTLMEIIQSSATYAQLNELLRLIRPHTRADGLWVDRLAIDIARAWTRLPVSGRPFSPAQWIASAMLAGVLDALDTVWEDVDHPDNRTVIGGIFAAHETNLQEVENVKTALLCACFIVCGIKAL